MTRLACESRRTPPILTIGSTLLILRDCFREMPLRLPARLHCGWKRPSSLFPIFWRCPSHFPHEVAETDNRSTAPSADIGAAWSPAVVIFLQWDGKRRTTRVATNSGQAPQYVGYRASRLRGIIHALLMRAHAARALCIPSASALRVYEYQRLVRLLRTSSIGGTTCVA